MLRQAFIQVRHKHPFQIDAIVVLPDHLHCIWVLPPGGEGFSVRWGLIKSYFSRSIEKGERIPQVALWRGERGLWQRRFWDNFIRDDADHHAHLDYIHWNPVKHGLVNAVICGNSEMSQRIICATLRQGQHSVDGSGGIGESCEGGSPENQPHRTAFPTQIL